MSSPSSQIRCSSLGSTAGSLVRSPSSVSTTSCGPASRSTRRKPLRKAAPGPKLRWWETTSTGASGRLGTGGQHWPWIALDDEVGAIMHLLHGSMAGPVNLVGPTPATADRIMSAVAERLHRPYVIPVPEPVLKLGLGSAAEDLLLSSQKVRPQRLIDDGYRFRYPTFESALDAMLSPEPAPVR